MKTMSDLRSYVRSQARRDSRDYDAEGWRLESNLIERQREKVRRDFGPRWRSNTEELVPGNYGRLTILEDGTPYYVAGQYSPTEIWFWVHEYLNRTN
jgi:hypothetical protein